MIDIDCYDLKDCPDGDCDNCSISPAGAKWKEPDMDIKTEPGAETHEIKPYHKRFFKCPCGPEGREFSVEHLYEDNMATAGPWYCDHCGKGWKLEVGQGPMSHIKITDTGRRSGKTLVILELRPEDMKGHPLLLMTEGMAFEPDEAGGGEPVIDRERDRYFYEEHTCPTNWLKRVRELYTAGEYDPHGLFRYVETRPFSDEPMTGPEDFMADNEHGRMRVGKSVRTTKDAGAKDWTTDRSECQWGVEGTVIVQHDSHGLCYTVRHQDGSTACYDPEELELIGD